MKKVLLLTFAGLFSAGLMAQRKVDWSIETIVSPTKIEHQKPTIVNYIVKNKGADTAMVGDTVISVYLINNQLTTTRFFLLKTNLNPDSTIVIKDTIPAFNISNPSFNGSFQITAYLQNRPGLGVETQAQFQNNIKSVIIPYLGPGGNGVSVSTVNAGIFGAYPNPATNVINFNLPLSFETGIIATIVDITGKTVLSQNFNFADVLSMNVSALNNGIYILNVKSGDLSYQTKITIAK